MMLAATVLMTAPEASDASDVTVKIQTNKGDIELALDSAKAPETVANFVNYAKKGHYDGTIFHRVIKGFMIQGGGMTPDMGQKQTDKSVRNEAENGLKNQKGTVAMARTSDPHSATAQFFVNTADNAFLNFKAANMSDYGYCVFGKVTKGLDVVDQIEGVATGSQGGHQDVPTEAVVIEKVTVVE